MDTSTKLRVTRALQDGRTVEDVLRAEPALARAEVEEAGRALAALRVMAHDADEEISELIALDDAGTLTTDEAMRLMYLLHGSVEAHMTELAIQRAVREGREEIERIRTAEIPREHRWHLDDIPE